MSDKVVETAGKLMGTLPSQFLVLIMLNLVFICGTLWFLQRHDELRIEATRDILKVCTEGLAHSAPAK